MKRFRIALLGILAVSLFFSGCSKTENPSTGPLAAGKEGVGSDGKFGKPEKPKFKIPVTVERMDRARMYAYLQAVGSVVPVKEVELKPEMTGRIYYTKRWLEGDEAKKGESLATMDDREVQININEAQLQLELAQSAVRPSEAQLAQAKKDEEFKKVMYERGAISKAEFDMAALTRIQRENQHEQTLQNIKSREMSLKKLKQETEKVSIVFPFDGVLLPAQQSVATSGTGSKDGSQADLTLLNGQTVGANAVLCRLANIDQVFVALDVPAKDLTQVEIGQDVELEIYSRVGSEYKGKVADISTALNSSTRTYTVNVLVENPDHELRPGMFAKARIITEEKLDAIKIPRSMVQLRNNRDVVFVVKPKPEGAVKSATGEADLRIPEKTENRQLVMARGRDDSVAYAAGEVSGASRDFDPPVEEAEAEAGAAQPEVLEMVAEERVIQKGIENREDVEVAEGLQEGDLMVVLGYETLTDGIDVNVTIREKDPLESLR